MDDFVPLESKSEPIAKKALRKSAKARINPETDEDSLGSGIILISHLPHGFFEEELRGFFSQFGTVLRVRLGRSLKTGRSRGYAFVEFEFREVAKIAAESMHNYLMYERLLKCKLLDTNVDASKIFRAKSRITKERFPTLFRRRKLIRKMSKRLSKKGLEEEAEARTRRIERSNEKLAKLGINYKYEDNEESS